MLSFDDILDRYIKTGVYQYEAIGIIGLIEFCDGVEYTFMSILMAILKNEWSLTQNEVASLGSSFLLGVVTGNFLCAYIADIIGRRVSLIIFSALSVFIVLATSYSQNIGQILVLRLCFGLVFGATGPLCSVMISEIVEAKYRGRLTFSLTILYVLGKVYLVGLCFIFLNDYQSGNWRGLIRINAIPVSICFLGSIFYLQESIRYQLNKGRYSIAFQEINQIAFVNLGEDHQEITSIDKDQLIQWQQFQNQVTSMSKINKQGVLSSEYLSITLKLWLLLAIANYQNMSIFLLMPLLFQQKSSGFSSMLWLFLIELLFSGIIYNFIDNQKHGGRIKIIKYSAMVLIVANLLLYIFQDNILFLGMLLIKLATRGVFSLSYVITCESYPLILRSKGSGLAQGIGKLVAIPAPYVIFPIFFIHPYLPFLLMTLLSFIMLVVAYLYPTDRTQKHLEGTSRAESV